MSTLCDTLSPNIKKPEFYQPLFDPLDLKKKGGTEGRS